MREVIKKQNNDPASKEYKTSLSTTPITKSKVKKHSNSQSNKPNSLQIKNDFSELEKELDDLCEDSFKNKPINSKINTSLKNP